MASINEQRRRAWAIAQRQHQVITYGQLLALGFTDSAIRHRVAIGRLYRVHQGVYAVGRRDLSRLGEWMAAVLACGPCALLSHVHGGALYGIVKDRPGPIDVCVPRLVRRGGIRVHRGVRPGRLRRGIPVTSPVDTLIDLATCLPDEPWEAAVNEADSLGLCTPDAVRAAAEATSRRGAAAVRRLLDRHTFTLTDSVLERLFVRIALRAGLPKPLTRQWVNGWRVDFYWPGLKLVIETDGLTYHRTAAKQTRDVLRDQAHARARLRYLRFTHWQIRYEPDYVETTLRTVAA
jgi:very-short-patch-repair endonuclease